MAPASHQPSNTINKKRIGVSEGGLPLLLYHAGPLTAPLRILIIAGQHGDEPLSIQAVKNFLSTINLTESICIAAIPCLNPDGAAKHKRLNAAEIDLNRDHQRLQSSENRALHQMVCEFCPHLIIDVHTYPPRRKHLLAQSLIYHHDIFVDVANTPALNPAAKDLMQTQLMPKVIAIVQRQYTANRYTLINPSGRGRHSSPDVSNARNMLALRYNACTLLLEGRESKLAREQQQTLAALTLALKTAMDWAQQHTDQLHTICDSSQLNNQVVLQSCYVNSTQKYTMLFRNNQQQTAREVVLPGKYSPDIKPTLSINLPQIYLIPKQLKKLLQTLEYHSFISKNPQPTYAEQYVVKYCQKI